MNLHERPYDSALSDILRIAVRERRKSPDGKLLHITTRLNGTDEVAVYPWDRMKLGDFFFVPLLGRVPGKLQVRFRQVAARRDWELSVLQFPDPHGKPSLRVCLTLVDVSEIKKKAQHHHDVRGLRISDGKWTATRAARHGKPVKQAPVPNFAPKSKGKPELILIKNDDPPPAQEIDATLLPGYDRDAIVAERLAKLMKQG